MVRVSSHHGSHNEFQRKLKVYQSKKMPGDCLTGRSGAALLLIDVINDCDFPESQQLVKFAIPMARKIAALAERARQQAFRSSTSGTTPAGGGPISSPL